MTRKLSRAADSQASASPTPPPYYDAFGSTLTTTLGLFFAAGLFIWSAWTLVSFADISPELSDSGFYLLMHRESEHILPQITVFGILLKTFFGEPSVQIMRYIHYALLFMGPAVFMWVASATHEMKEQLPLRMLLSATTGISAWSYFKWMLLDPNYNSLAIVFFCTTLSTLWVLVQRFKSHDLTSVALAWPSALCAVSVFALGLSKVSSALIILIIVIPLFMAVICLQNHKRLRATCLKLGAALMWAALGVTGIVILIWLRVSPPWALVSHVINGLEFSTTLGAHKVDLATIKTNLGYLWDSLYAVAEASLWPLSVFALTSVALVLLSQKAYWPWLGRLFVCGALAFWGYFLLPLWDDFAKTAIYTWIFALGTPLLAVLAPKNRTELFIFTALCALAPAILVFGSFATWSKHAAMYSGVPVLSFALLALYIPRLRLLMSVTTLCLSSLIVTAAFQEARQNPYRLGGPESTAVEPVMLRGELFRATPALKKTYAVVDSIASLLKDYSPQSRPMLIDMTGRVPSLHWALDMKLPATAWTISGYRGSDAVLEWALTRVPDSEFTNTWVLIDHARDDGTRYGLSTDVLNTALAKVDLQFPKDFKAVHTLPISYMKFDATLYMPKTD